MPEETIITRVEVFDAYTGKFKKIIQTTQEFSDMARKVTTVTSEMTKRGLKPVEKTVKTMTGIFRKFKMEQLSVMFGAQMISNAISGLFQPAMQALGIFELWSTVLEMIFLPILLELMPIFLSIFDFFMNLPEPIQLFIGAFLGIIGVITPLLAIGAALLLFLGGLVIVFGVTAGAAAAIVGVILAVIAVVAALVVEFIYLWRHADEIHAKFKEMIGAAWDWILDKLSKAWDWIKKTAGSIWDWVKEKIGGAWDWVKEKTGSVWDWVKEKILGVWNSIKGVWDKVVDFFGGNNEIKVTGGKSTKQMGGYVPHTGLYKLHAGETVQQAGMSSFNANIVINASSNVDIELLKSQLSGRWNDELKRMSRI